MTPGTVALPHGWGHRGGWKLANEAGGANSNLLAPSDPEDLEPLAGMALPERDPGQPGARGRRQRAERRFASCCSSGSRGLSASARA